MRIGETKEIGKGINFDEACILGLSDWDEYHGDLKRAAVRYAEKVNYVKHSVLGSAFDTYSAKFKVNEYREMTPEEEAAFGYIRFQEYVASIGYDCKKCIMGSSCYQGRGICDGVVDNILEGKEVIE